MNPVPRLRDYSGPALLSYGFRPFFLLGALYSALVVLIWLPVFFGVFDLPTALGPRDWHVHEMLFGYLAAVITGFLLTAVPNWTGRLPIQGLPLLALVLVWLVGRIATAVSGLTGWLPAAILDMLFLIAVGGAVAREIVAGRNWGNGKVVIVIAVLVVANGAFHAEAHWRGAADYSIRLGIGAVVTLLMLIGGRIVPSFTRNWLVKENPGRLPASFGYFDLTAVAVGVVALGFWIGWPHSKLAAAALGLAALFQAARLMRWAGDRTLREPLLTVLHIGFAFVPLGFALLAVSAAGYIPQTVGIHAWTVGAFGVMTLAVMTRATLGHTGRALTASLATRLIYVAVVVAAVVRIWAGLQPMWTVPLVEISAAAWIMAFFGFVVVYGPFLLRPRSA